MRCCDVLVVGGGCAGVAAALAAAREGSETVLVERSATLAGMGSNALVHTICGLFHPDITRGAQWLNPGIPTEIGMAIQELTGHGAELMGRVFVLRHDPTQLADLAAQMCSDEAGLDVLQTTEVAHIEHEPGRWRVDVQSGNTMEVFSTRSLVDTTGDALLTRWCSPESRATAELLYRPALVCRIRGVSGPVGPETLLKLAATLVRGVQGGTLPPAALSATFRQSPARTDEVFLTLDLEAGGVDWDPSNQAKCQSTAEHARTLVSSVWEFLRRENALFASSTELIFPDQLGIRESSRWTGDHILAGAEVLRCQRFADEMALAGWPLEMRETARGPRFRYFERPEPAGIPAGSLQSVNAPGVFFAGRCMSCDHEALASVRVMGTCLATGQAAGSLAARWAAALG